MCNSVEQVRPRISDRDLESGSDTDLLGPRIRSQPLAVSPLTYEKGQQRPQRRGITDPNDMDIGYFRHCASDCPSVGNSTWPSYPFPSQSRDSDKADLIPDPQGPEDSMCPKQNKYESTWEVLLEQVGMINSQPTAVEECQSVRCSRAGASGRYHVKEVFLGMRPIQKKVEPREGKSESKT